MTLQVDLSHTFYYYVA